MNAANPSPLTTPAALCLDASAWSLRVCELAQAAELPAPKIRLTDEALTLDWMDRPGVTARLCYRTNTVTLSTVTFPTAQHVTLPADPHCTVERVKEIYLLAGRARAGRLIAIS